MNTEANNPENTGIYYIVRISENKPNAEVYTHADDVDKIAFTQPSDAINSIVDAIECLASDVSITAREDHSVEYTEWIDNEPTYWTCWVEEWRPTLEDYNLGINLG